MFSWYLGYFQSDLSLNHHFAAIRFLTAHALWIGHSCCTQLDVRFYRWENEQPIPETFAEMQEEAVPKEDEIASGPVELEGLETDSDNNMDIEKEENEEQYFETPELQELVELVKEFEGEILTRLADASQKADQLQDFWKTYWVDRVEEALAELDSIKMSDEQRCGVEAIGVVWYDARPLPLPPPPPTSHLDLIMPEYWFKRLEEIVPD